MSVVLSQMAYLHVWIMAEATMAVAQILMLKSRFKRERRNCRADTDIVSMRRRREGVREKPNIPNANARD